MGQVTSRISEYFSDPAETNNLSDPKSNGNGIFTRYVKRTVRFKDSEKFGISNSILNRFSHGELATPRLPLKRSRDTSFATSIPDAIQDIFSSSKRIKISKDEYLSYPFLVDEKTVRYYRNSKVMIILRGLPGSGKSTIAKAIQRKFIASKICSADYFFMKDGEYVHDRSLIRDAHNQAQQNAIGAVLDQMPVVVIDNTNIKLWEMQFYLDLAKEFGYISVIVEPNTPWNRDVADLTYKNVHQVNEDIINLKLKSFEALLPLYYGWFLNDMDSHLILENARSWIEKAFDSSDFRKDFYSTTGVKKMSDLIKFFKKPGKELTLHCTAKYIGKTLSEENKEYREKVKNYVGKVYDIEIVGFVLTPRTFGARVKLSSDQLQLWGMNDNEPVPEAFWEIDITTEMTENGGDSADEVLDSDEDVMENGEQNKDVMETADDKDSTNLNGSINDSTSFVVNDVMINGESVNFSPSKSYDHLFNHSTNKVNDNNANESDSNVLHMNGSNDPQEEIVQSSPSKQMNISLTSIDRGESPQDSNHAHITPSPRNRKKSSKSLPIPNNSITIEESTTRPTLLEQLSNLDVDVFSPTSGLGSRAHLTLGCASDVSAVTTGLDLLMAIEKEKKTNEFNPCSDPSKHSISEPNQKTYETASSSTDNSFPNGNCTSVISVIEDEEGDIRNYGNGVWAFYPERRLKVASVFSAWN